VPTRFWNSKKYRCKKDREYKEAEIINKKLDNWENLLRKVAEQFEVQITPPDLVQYKKAISNLLDLRSGKQTQGFVDFAVRYMAECDKKPDTKKKYKVAISPCRNMKSGKYNTAIQKYRLCLFFVVQVPHDKKTFSAKGETKHYAKNTIGSVTRSILIFFNDARRLGLHNLTVVDCPVEEEEVDSIYLSVDELIQLHSLEITPETVRTKLKEDPRECNIHKRIQSLIDNRDRFLIGAFTAMRFGDYSGLSELRSTDQFISKRTSKTVFNIIY